MNYEEIIHKLYIELGHKLKVERTKLDFKQEHIAEQVGIQQRYLAKIERGDAKPEFAKIWKMATLYGISLDYLTENEADLSSDYIVNTINIRLQMLDNEEKLMLLEAMEYYIKNIKDKKAIRK